MAWIVGQINEQNALNMGMDPQWAKLTGDFSSTLFLEGFTTVTINGIRAYKNISTGEIIYDGNFVAGSGVGNLAKGASSNPLSNDVIKQLENAPIQTKLNKVTEQMEPYMKQVLGDDYKLILRRDIGEGFSHGDLNHWNIEVQTFQGNMKFDRHLYVDVEGNIQKIVDYIPQRKGRPIVNVIFDNTNK